MKGTIFFFFKYDFHSKRSLKPLTVAIDLGIQRFLISDKIFFFFFHFKNLRNFKEIKDTDKFKDRNDLRFECSLLIAEALFLKNIA